MNLNAYCSTVFVFIINYLFIMFCFLVNKQDKKKEICELVIPGYNFVGVGNSKDKKSAQKKATKDFLLFLASQNAIPAIPKVTKILNHTNTIFY